MKLKPKTLQTMKAPDLLADVECRCSPRASGRDRTYPYAVFRDGELVSVHARHQGSRCAGRMDDVSGQEPWVRRFF